MKIKQQEMLRAIYDRAIQENLTLKQAADLLVDVKPQTLYVKMKLYCTEHNLPTPFYTPRIGKAPKELIWKN